MRHTVWAVTLVTLATLVVLVSAYTDECSHHSDPLLGFESNFRTERFRYNTTSELCEMFDRRSDDHHPNNFPRLNDCNQACVKECSHHPDPLVACKFVSLPMFRYNTASRECEKYQRDSCDRHPNNFSTLKDCNQACVTECNHHPDPLLGLQSNFHTKRFRYNTTSEQCEMFDRRSDDHHPNNFPTLKDCNHACVKECSHHRDSIPLCRSMSFSMFRYNTASGECEKYQQDSCDEHPNNFLTLKDCNQACVTECSHHPDPLLGFITNFRTERFRYNTTSEQCEMFHRRSDDHHPNNFPTLKDCNQACVTECSHHPDPLVACKFVSSPMFRYNIASRECEKYQRDSCDHHPNNFSTLKDCNQSCVYKEPQWFYWDG